LTANGKLDRKALPAPELDAYGVRGYEEPQGEMEQAVTVAYAEVLHLDPTQISRHDNFFELGGNSLSAIWLMSQLHHRLGFELPVRNIFEQPVVHDFAALAEAKASEIEQVGARQTQSRPAALSALTGPRRTWGWESVNRLFAEKAEQISETPACWDEEQSLNYRELYERSSQIARALRSSGVRASDRVALNVARGVDFLAALLGIWKAGAIYVPLDPAYSDQDIARITLDTEPKVILVAGGATKVPLAHVTLLSLDSIWEDTSEPDGEPEAELLPDDLAYIAYTAGPAEQPKAVAVRHRQLMNCLNGLWETQPFGTGEVVMQQAEAGSAISIKEMLIGLLQGVPTFIAGDPLVLDTPRFAQVLQEHRVTRLNLRHSQLDALLDHAGSLRSLRRVVVAGEPFPVALAARFSQLLPEADLYNNWCMNETSDLAYYHAAGPKILPPGSTEAAGLVPMGQPVANVSLHLLDEGMRPVAVGAVGELYVEGAAVGPGYWRQEKRTKELFLPNPFAETGSELQTLFRTGNLARLGQDGALHYLGRRDLAKPRLAQTIKQRSNFFAGVLPLRANGTKPPLFCMPPANGMGWIYERLLQSIDPDRPVYVLQSKGFEGEPSPATMEELVSEHTEHIRAVQPEGPYHLCGWSFGGAVAYRIALEFQQSGQNIGLLGLLDFYPPAPEQLSDDSEDPLTTPDLRRFLRIWATEALVGNGYDPDSISKDLAERAADVVANNLALMKTANDNFAAMPRFAGDLLLLRARMNAAMSKEEAQTAWVSYIAGEVYCFDIESSHGNMLLQEAPALEIGRILDDALAGLLPQSDSVLLDRPARSGK
jgi:amino acid adenylation domain-containing protein